MAKIVEAINQLTSNTKKLPGSTRLVLLADYTVIVGSGYAAALLMLFLLIRVVLANWH